MTFGGQPTPLWIPRASGDTAADGQPSALWVAGGYQASTGDDGDGDTDRSLIAAPARKYCEDQNQAQKKANDACRLPHGPAKEICEQGKTYRDLTGKRPEPTPGGERFDRRLIER